MAYEKQCEMPSGFRLPKVIKIGLFLLARRYASYGPVSVCLSVCLIVCVCHALSTARLRRAGQLATADSC